MFTSMRDCPRRGLSLQPHREPRSVFRDSPRSGTVPGNAGSAEEHPTSSASLDAAAGGCFAFQAIRWIDGKRTTITGVVLGQPGHDQIAAGLAAAEAMVDRISGHSRRQVQAPPELGQRTLAPGTAPRSH